jgi:hypothetical protein
MTLYDALMVLGLVILVGIILKGFWAANRVKPTDQRENWRDYWQAGNDPPQAGD